MLHENYTEMSTGLRNMTESRHKFSLTNKLARLIWMLVWALLFRPFSLRIFRKWRVLILKMFGADVSWTVTVNSSVKIWAPWNLTLGPYSCIGSHVDCYNQGRITIGANTTISQKTYLCASSHDYTHADHNLILRPIHIDDKVWIAADAFIGPGVTIREGAVVGARAVVNKNVDKWTVVAGNPAQFIKIREIKN